MRGSIKSPALKTDCAIVVEVNRYFNQQQKSKVVIINTNIAKSIISAVGAMFLMSGIAIAEDKVDWNALKGAKVSLAKGLDAASKKGNQFQASSKWKTASCGFRFIRAANASIRR